MHVKKVNGKPSPIAHPTHWRDEWTRKVHTPDDLVRFVDAVGCCTLAPIHRYPDFPNQDEVMGEVYPGTDGTWFWKDDLHAEKRIYYTRVFGGQTGYISYVMLPVLIATNGAVIDELLYHGALTPDTLQVYQIIDEYGPIPIRNLKRLLTPDAKHNANKSIVELERRFLITKTGITGRTMGTYGYIWDLVERWLPEVLTAAGEMTRRQAEAKLREHLSSYGIPADSLFYVKVLGWNP
ncbi:MAG: AlkZ-related protein [Armatimonadota bacterium]